jgi:fructokinase
LVTRWLAFFLENIYPFVVTNVLLLRIKITEMKRTIYTIGETVYDIIFQHGQIRAGRAGGSMLNASVSLGRLGYDVCFISEVGNDDLGNLIVDFLDKNGVNTSFLDRFTDGKTPVAFAFLDENKNAKYSFLKQYPQNRLQQQLPVITGNDILMFGSFFSISMEVRQPVLKFVQQAKAAGAIVIYDPNIRSPHKNDLPELLPLIMENFSLADIVRTSHDDFLTIFETENPEEAFRIINQLDKASLIFTQGAGGIHLFTPTYINYFEVPKIEVKSTIGAGDNFNAGIAISLIDLGITKPGLRNLTIAQWDQIIHTGIDLSQQVCKSYDNYVGRKVLPKRKA